MSEYCCDISITDDGEEVKHFKVCKCDGLTPTLEWAQKYIEEEIENEAIGEEYIEEEY